MPLTDAQLTQLKTDAATVTAAIASLVADPAVDPLQTELDAANATIASLKNEIVTVKADLAKTQTDLV